MRGRGVAEVVLTLLKQLGSVPACYVITEGSRERSTGCCGTLRFLLGANRTSCRLEGGSARPELQLELVVTTPPERGASTDISSRWQRTRAEGHCTPAGGASMTELRR